MIPQLPSRNRTPRQREHTGGSSSSTFFASDSSHGYGRSKSQAAERAGSRKETITYKHEWRIDDISQLAAHVEGLDEQLQPVIPAPGQEGESASEILRTGRKTADDMYKFDLGVTTDDDGSPESRCLSLYICSLLRSREVYHCPAFTSAIFIGITGTSKSGREHGSTTYLWTHEERYNFQPHDDFIKIRLPTLSHIARDPSVVSENAITLCIRIEQDYGEQPNFQKDGFVQVPNDLVSALGALIDTPNGADVKFVCLEHEIQREDGQDGGDEPGLRSRKRVIYANSQVLSKRSSYFEDLFATSFVETAAPQSDRFKTVVVESADFNTVYWMMRFLYTNELLFDEQNDHIRDLMIQQSIEAAVARKALVSSSSSHPPSHEWQWRSLDTEYTEPLSAMSSSDHDPETRSIASSNHSYGSTMKSASTKSSTAPTASTNAKASPRHTNTNIRKSESISPTRQSTVSSRASSDSYPSSRTVGGASKAYPARIHTQSTDPHDHPVKEPTPACAMAIYVLAHQYRLDTLTALARKHILSHLTHSTCIPVFLASYRYTDLHEQVLSYIHSEWKDVKANGEFVRCFQEVARGVWGEEGGTLLADMVSRLPY